MSCSDAPKPQKRSILIQLMGYPKDIGDDDYENRDVQPDWPAVLDRIATHPAEAKIVEDDHFPLDDALWIEAEPVPTCTLIRLLRVFPKALTELSFEIASQNASLSPQILKVLRGADVNNCFSKKRSALVQLMGFPPYFDDDEYDQNEIIPDWEKVRKRLVAHPEEAKIDEGGCHPLADALWIENEPVPIDVVQTMMIVAPESLTDMAFENASANDYLDADILRLMFTFDGGQESLAVPEQSDEGSFINVAI